MTTTTFMAQLIISYLTAHPGLVDLSQPAIVVAALQEANQWGFWAPLVAVLRGLIIAAGGVGVILGLAIKATAGPREDGQTLGNRVLEGALVGLLVGLLSQPFYDLIVAWTS